MNAEDAELNKTAREVREKRESELEQKVRAVQEKYGHLLTREAALAHVSAQEGAKGGNAGARSHEWPGGAAGSSFEARVLRTFAQYEFQKAGRKGKVCRVELERLGGSLDPRPILVLWDSDAEKLQKGEIAVGDLISVSNAYLKEGELHIGRNGAVKRIARASAADAKKAEREARGEKLAVIKELKASGNLLEAVVESNGKPERLRLSGGKALSFLGLKQTHEGISLDTLVALKRSHLVGRAVRL